MAQTLSKMIPLGTIAPDFELTDVKTGELCSLKNLAGSKAFLIIFMCNHCPYVKHVLDEIIRISVDYSSKGVTVIGISSNDAMRYPDDSPEKMKELAINKNFNFPYLYDETQEVAKAYDAACTPDFYIFDKDFSLAYRGQLDDARPKNTNPINGKDIRAALDQLLDGKPLTVNQIPSIGCNIKWKE